MSARTFDGWELDELITAVADQDRAAFAELYRRTSPKLYGIVLRILKETGRTDDAVQDAYTRIWRNAGGYDAARGRPITWLATIARNIAIDVRRGEIARGAHAAADVDLDTLTSSSSGATGEELATLRVCLDRLAADQRALVVAAYLEGESREELAERTKRPIGTIKSWLHRSLAQLKVCLDGRD